MFSGISLQNFSLRQKIIIAIIIEIFILVIIGSVAFLIFRKPDSVPIRETNSISDSSIQDQIGGVETQLYSLLRGNSLIYEGQKISDATIREGSYENTSYGAKFIVDIDSLKATYIIEVESMDDGLEHPNGINISCPPIDQMKYQDTFCKGSYNNTASPELYLPHVVYAQDGTISWEIVESGLSYNTIVVAVRSCGDANTYAKNAQEAKNWLDNTPIKQDEHSIIYREYCDQYSNF